MCNHNGDLHHFFSPVEFYKCADEDLGPKNTFDTLKTNNRCYTAKHDPVKCRPTYISKRDMCTENNCDKLFETETSNPFLDENIGLLCRSVVNRARKS